MARYRRKPLVAETDVEGELFLVDSDSDAVFHLNAVGSGVWRLLTQPREAAEICQVVAAAFPDVAAAEIDRDVRASLDAMAAGGLVFVGD